MTKILLIEDEEGLLSAMQQFFDNEGNTTVAVTNLFDAEDQLLDHQFDVIVLDINLPDGNGLKLLDIIKKEQENSGVVIVSARNSLDDKIEGLDLGADDYITKPFHLAELNSRVKALIRRKVFKGNDALEFNEIKIDIQQKEVLIEGRSIDLTRKEYNLLVYFITNKNRVLTKEAIAEHLWGEELDLIDNFDFIYAHIKNLRKKIINAGGNDYLKTVYGMGYKYTDV